MTKLAPGLDREAVMARLADEGIEVAHYVPCVHLQPYMRERYAFSEGVCPVAEDASDRSMALPFFTGIEAADQELVVEKLREVLAAFS